MKRINGALNAFRREIRSITRDMDIITIILIAPLFYAFFYGSVYLNKSEHDVPVTVVDMDHSSLSANLIRYLDSHQLVSVNGVLSDYGSAINKVYSMESQAVLYIPDGFEASLKEGNDTDLKLYLNTTRFLISNDINKAVNEVTATMAGAVKLRFFQAQGYSYTQAKEMIEPLDSQVHSLFNPTESYGDFLIPGLLVLILQQTLLIGLSESISKERENKSIGELFYSAGRSVSAMVNGKGAFYFLMYSAYALFFYTVHFSVFKISFRGSVSALIILTGLFLIAVVYLSIFISSFFSRKIVSLQVIAFTSYPVFLMSGYPWPIQAMPLYIRVIAQLLPSTPYLDAFGRIVHMGAGWNDVLPQMWHIILLIIIGMIISWLRMRSLVKGAETAAAAA